MGRAAPADEPPPKYTPPRLRKAKLGRCRLTLLPSVKGLTSERARVSAALQKVKPDCLAVGVSPGEIEGLTQLATGKAEKPEFFLSQHEELYAQGLAFLAQKQADKVELPPPAFEAAVKLGLEQELVLEGLDLEEEAYTEAYIKHITRWQWIRQGLRLKKLKKRAWASTTPADFALEYDDALCALPGYAALERTREAGMARRLTELAEEHAKILAVIELPRVEGVLARLAETKKQKEDWSEPQR